MPVAWMIGLSAVLAIAAALTWGARHYALRRNLMDQPGERRSHGVATPRGGGIAIVLTLLLAAVAAAVAWPAARITLGVFSLGLALVAGIGWWDDHRPLPAIRRLLVHMVAAALLGGLVWQASGSLVHAVLAALFTTSLINIWNFMDGINGLATTQAILAGLAFAMVMPLPFALAGVVLALACLGFCPSISRGHASSWGTSAAARWAMRSRPWCAWPAWSPRSTGCCCWCPFRPSSWTQASHCFRACCPGNGGWKPTPNTFTSARSKGVQVTPW